MSETQDPYLSSIINRYVVHSLPNIQAAYKDNIGAVSSPSLKQLTGKLLQTISSQDLLCLYLAFHTYVYMLARQTADIVVDVTKVARDVNYSQQAGQQLMSVTGLPITFDDATEIQQYCSFDPTLINWKEIRENIDFAVGMLDHACDRQELLRFGAELVDETAAEIAISEKYVGRVRHEVTSLKNERDAVHAEISALTAELGRVTRERDAALAERDRFSRQYGAAMTKMNRLASELVATRVEGEELRTENTRLQSELAAAIAARETEASALAALRTELSQLATDRDRLAVQNERWFNAAVVWAAEAVLRTPRLRERQWFHGLVQPFRTGFMTRWISRIKPKRSPSTLARRAQDAGEWEQAVRFYVDALRQNSQDPTIWTQLGHALKETGKTSAAEIAYRKAAAVAGKF